MSVKEFGDNEYWEDRYRNKNEEYEWYQPWSTIRFYILPYLSQSKQILNVGCGNSPMGVEMLKEGFDRVTNIDISHSVIEQMKNLYINETKAEWITMDCTNLQFPENSFDAIIEKGTIDALICKNDNGISIKQFLIESYRVLRPGGVFLSISFGKPSLRLPHFRDSNLSWKIQDPILIPKLMLPDQYYYLYVSIK